MQNLIVTLLLLLCALQPLAVHAEVNAGFVRGFWYSDDTFFANDTVRVYVAIRNNTDADLTGSVTFFDNDKKIGTQSVAALNGRIIESWFDWTPSYGEHTLRAELSRLKLSVIGSSTESIDSTLAAATDTRFIDLDTDNDALGNEDDTDDDGDTLSDVEENENHTDPLMFTRSVVSAASSTGGAVAQSERASHTKRTGTTTEGIERYLTPSRADALLSNITTWTDNAKQELDTYRAARTEKLRTPSTPETTVNSDGFGEITRSTAPVTTVATPPASTGFIADMIRIVGSILHGLMSGLLAAISWVLGHPILIQVLILVGILAGMYYTAKKIGGRPTKIKK